MSLPPSLFPKASTAGIVDNLNGDRVVAASRRPDGTYRKELKIRPGFTPDEDVKRYRATRAAESDARAAVKGKIPGLTPAAPVAAALAGMTKAQKKNLNRKKKRHEEGEAGEEEGDVPDEWDDGEEGAPSTTVAGSKEKGVEKGKSVEEKDTKSATVEKAPEKVSTPATSSPASSATPATPSSTTPESSKVRALKKKIRQAEQLKERATLGLYLPPSERAKIQGIPDLEAELAKLSVSDSSA